MFGRNPNVSRFFLGMAYLGVVKKLLSISPFVTMVPYVAINTFYELLYKNLLQIFVFKNSNLYILSYIYVCFVLPFFLQHFLQKR